MTERPKVRHWKCRVGVKPHRGFESRPLRLSLEYLGVKLPTPGSVPGMVVRWRNSARGSLRACCENAQRVESAYAFILPVKPRSPRGRDFRANINERARRAGPPARSASNVVSLSLGEARGAEMISQTVEYAYVAVVYLASQSPLGRTTDQVATATRVPKAYLSKVLQGLVRAGIVSSQRGIGGGMTLVKLPSELTILEVVNAVDPIERIRSCP